jgi:hypothetical protein
VSVHSPPRLYFEPLKLLNFDSNAYPDLAFLSNVAPDPGVPKVMRIRNPAYNLYKEEGGSQSDSYLDGQLEYWHREQPHQVHHSSLLCTL